MKFLGLDKVLCLCPHPDDVEYSISGTVLKYPDTEFHVLFMSQGTVADPSSSMERLLESKSFWDELGVDNIHFKRMPNNDYIQANFDTMKDSDWIGVIEAEYDTSEFDAILSTSPEDSHYEHVITNRVMMSLGRAKPLALIEYRSPSTLRSWEPNFFVELSTTQTNRKLGCLLTSFNSQNDAGYFSFDCMEEFNKDFISLKKGVKFVEQFKIRTLYGL